MARLVKPLTATQVQNAKPKEAAYKLFDGGGLFLQVTPAGGKHWKMKYRQANGKEGDQTVFHFHMHVVPRHGNDGIALSWPRKDPPRAFLEDYAAQLRSALAQAD